MSADIVVYRGFKVAKNYSSIHGTGARLAKFKGYNLRTTVSTKHWFSNLAEAQQFIDFLYANVETLPAMERAAVQRAAQLGA